MSFTVSENKERYFHNEIKVIKELWQILVKISKIIKCLQSKVEQNNFDSKISVSDLKVLLIAIFAIKGYKRIVVDN